MIGDSFLFLLYCIVYCIVYAMFIVLFMLCLFYCICYVYCILYAIFTVFYMLCLLYCICSRNPLIQHLVMKYRHKNTNKNKQEALDRAVWRTGFGSSYGPMVRPTTERMNK
jgi:hypothetical protein